METPYMILPYAVRFRRAIPLNITGFGRNLQRVVMNTVLKMWKVVLWAKDNLKHQAAWAPRHLIMCWGTIKTCSGISQWEQCGSRNVHSLHDEFIILKPNEHRVPFYDTCVKNKSSRLLRIWEKPQRTEKRNLYYWIFKNYEYRNTAHTHTPTFLHYGCNFFLHYKG